MKKYIVLFAVMILAQFATAYAGDESTSMNYGDAKRAPRSYGRMTVEKKDVNPEGQTKIFFERCFHPGIGNLTGCSGRLYKTDESTGWLDKEGVGFDNTNNSSWKSVALPAGKYYMKIQYSEAGKYYYAMGELVVAPFVTNFVHVQLE